MRGGTEHRAAQQREINKTKTIDNIQRERGFVRERTRAKQMIPGLVLHIPGTTERIPEEPLQRFQSKQHNCEFRPRGQLFNGSTDRSSTTESNLLRTNWRMLWENLGN